MFKKIMMIGLVGFLPTILHASESTDLFVSYRNCMERLAACAVQVDKARTPAEKNNLEIALYNRANNCLSKRPGHNAIVSQAQTAKKYCKVVLGDTATPSSDDVYVCYADKKMTTLLGYVGDSIFESFNGTAHTNKPVEKEEFTFHATPEN